MADYGYGANDLQGLDAGMGTYDATNLTREEGGINGQPDESGNFNNFPGGFAGASKAGGLGDFVQGLFTDKGGNLNTQLLGGIGGGILGALGANTPNIKKVGYQGGIPKYDAVRNMVTAPPTKAQGYRPGQGGINYGGDVTFTRQPGSPTGSSGGGGGGSSTLGNLAKVAGGAGLAGLIANYLGNSGGGTNAISNILKGVTGGAPAGGGRVTPMPKVTAGGAPVSNMGGGTRGSGELTTPGGEYAGGDEFDGIDDQIRANENDLASPSLSEEDIQAEWDRIYGEVPPPYMPTYDEIYPSYDWGSGITMDDPYTFLDFAKGGSTGRYLQGNTDGMADKIPARIGQKQPAALSHGEFVVPADVVSHLGNGNSDAGAKKLYQMMDKIRTARTGTKKQGKEINPDKFMPGGLAQAYASGGSVQRFNTGGTAVSGLGTAANAGVTGSETTPNTFAGEYIGDMLGKGQALANAPYQQYMGPLTAGESGLQSKVFGGLQNVNFPSNFGQSFSSTGAYTPPQMNMGAYQQRPIGTGQPAVGAMPAMEYGVPGSSTFGTTAQPPMMLSDMRYRSPEEKASIDPSFDTMMSKFGGNQKFQQMLNQGSNGFGDFGSNQITASLQNQGPAQPQTYEDYLESVSMFHALPQTREQFDAGQKQLGQQRQQGMDMLGRGNMSEIMAGLGGQPGQMPPSGMGGLAGLLGGMRQPPGLDQNAINANPRGFAEFQKGAMEQERQRPGSTMFSPQQPQQTQGIASQYMNPYLQSVLDPQMAELRRQNDITNMMSNAKATGMGAFGGGRQAIMNAENNRNLMQEMNKTVGQGYASAFDRAQQQFNAEQAQGMGLARLMADQGATQRGIEAEGIAADKAAFEAARENPYKMLQFQQSMLQGMPISATNIETATPTKLQEILSGIGGGIKMVGNTPSNVSMKSVKDLLGNLGLGDTPG